MLIGLLRTDEPPIGTAGATLEENSPCWLVDESGLTDIAVLLFNPLLSVNEMRYGLDVNWNYEISQILVRGIEEKGRREHLDIFVLKVVPNTLPYLGSHLTLP